MEKQPDGANILVCWNPELGQPSLKVIDGLSRFIGGHYLLVHPVTEHTSVITMKAFHEAVGAVEPGHQIDEAALDKIHEALIDPILN